MTMWQQDIIQDPRYREAFQGVTIYGVAGTNGSGKDSLMDLLVERGFYVFNASNSVRDVAYAIFKSIDRGGHDTPLGIVGEAYRAAYPGGLVEIGLLTWLFRVSVLPDDLRPKGLVIGSIRSVSEVNRLKEFGGKLVVVDADPHVRYERLQGRGRADDSISFEEFQQKEANEMAAGQTDPTKFSMAAAIEQADIRVINDGSDLAVFKTLAFKALGL